MLRMIADGVLSGRGASARDLCDRAGNGVTQRHLEYWSHHITVACDHLGTARPFKQLDVPSLGTVYQMDPEMAHQIKAALNGDGQHLPPTTATAAAD